MVVALLVSSYMLFDPADWVQHLMDLTHLTMDFKAFLLLLGFVGFAVAFGAEVFVFPRFARAIGKSKAWLMPKYQKKRKEYKVIEEKLLV